MCVFCVCLRVRGQTSWDSPLYIPTSVENRWVHGGCIQTNGLDIQDKYKPVRIPRAIVTVRELGDLVLTS